MFESRFTPTEFFFYSNKGLREVVVSLAREGVFGYFRLRFVTEIPQRIPLHESPLPLVNWNYQFKITHWRIQPGKRCENDLDPPRCYLLRSTRSIYFINNLKETTYKLFFFKHNENSTRYRTNNLCYNTCVLVPAINQLYYIRYMVHVYIWINCSSAFIWDENFHFWYQ